MTTRRPAEVFPPGELLREELEYRGLPLDDYAGILSGDAITPEVAQWLEDRLDISAQFWLNLEAMYREWAVEG